MVLLLKILVSTFLYTSSLVFSRVLLLVIFLAGLVCIPVYSGGNREAGFGEVEGLIAKKQYNEALMSLADIIRNNPDSIDFAQKYVLQIRDIRETYNDSYEDLVDTLYKDRDVEEALNIIEELENIDNNPNISTVESVNKAKRSAELVNNNNIYNDIMARARIQLDKGQFDKAMAIYLEGFVLDKEHFYESGYGNLVLEPVEGQVETALTISNFIITNLNNYLNDFTKLTSLLKSSNFEETSRTDFLADIKKMSLERMDIHEASLRFRTIDLIVEQLAEGEEKEFYLKYLTLMIEGRKDQPTIEGIRGSIDLFWEEQLSQLYTLSLGQLDDSLSASAVAYGNNQWDQAVSLYNISYDIARFTQDLANLWQSRYYFSVELAVEDNSTNVWAETPFLMEDARLKADFSQKMIALCGLQLRLDEIENADKNNLALLAEQRLVSSEILKKKLDLTMAWSAIAGIQKSMLENELVNENSIEIIAKLEKNLESLSIRNLHEETIIVNRQSLLNFNPLVLKFNELKERAAFNSVRIEGVEESLTEGETTLVKSSRYPRQSLEDIVLLNIEITTLSDSTDSYNQRIENEKKTILIDTELQEWLNKGKKLKNDIENLSVGIAIDKDKAEDYLFLAEENKSEMLYNLDESLLTLEDQQFDEAREYALLANNDLFESLSYQEDTEFRTRMDTEISALQARIQEEENRIVVADVRRLITQGKDQFFGESFERSEQSFLQGIVRWGKTNEDENTELTYWLSRVRTALSPQAGRLITETNPLYTEITQLLNRAREDFERGETLTERGDATSALEFLERAEQKIFQVKQPMPLNQEASVLQLRIDQLKAPDKFEASFRQSYNEAVRKLKVQPTEGYQTLQDLYLIKSDYPGIRQSIYQAEVILGIIVSPPDKKALAKSENLANQAEKIIKNNNRDFFPTALQQLNQAIELNPDNQRAIVLKDRVLIYSGGSSVFVLSSIDEGLFRDAEKEFIKGNYFEALILVEQILRSDKNNGKYPPLVDLKRRIESRI